jgi:hypothetical protein
MLTHTLGAISLPADVWWSDEFDWSALEQTAEYSITGALIVDQGVRLAGRQITLASADRGGWVPRSTVLALQAQRAAIGTSYTLTLADGRIYTVIHDAARQMQAAPVRPAYDMTDDTQYRVTIPLIEI